MQLIHGPCDRKLDRDCLSGDSQRAIVRYLDHVDDRIRRYVSAKEKLIALLEEERQAVIHRAVTRGLDPNVPLKPSGVEWLGDVPAHWEVTKLACQVRSSMRVGSLTRAVERVEPRFIYPGLCASSQTDREDYRNVCPLASVEKTGLDLLLTRNGTPYCPVEWGLLLARSTGQQRRQRITSNGSRSGTDREWIALTLEASEPNAE